MSTHASFLDSNAVTTCSVDEERRLVEQAKCNPAALALLYRRHYDAIHGYVLRRVGNRHDADDLTAEVFLSMVRVLHRFRWSGTPFRACLYRLATNAVNRWAKRRRRDVLRQLAVWPVEDLGVSTNVDVGWDLEFLQTALLSLCPRFQTVLSLYYLEELPIATVAEVLGCREGTVKSRLARGRDALRKILEQREVRYE